MGFVVFLAFTAGGILAGIYLSLWILIAITIISVFIFSFTVLDYEYLGIALGTVFVDIAMWLAFWYVNGQFTSPFQFIKAIFVR